MNVGQDLSAIFNSPQIAELALQAVQAGDMAERQLAMTERAAALRRESQVSRAAQADHLEAVDGRAAGAETGRRAPRRAARPARGAAPRPEAPPELAPAPPDGHRVDLVA